MSSPLQNGPRELVLANYVQWKGEPSAVYRPDNPPSYLSPRFGVLEYPGTPYHVYCTAGASFQSIPHSWHYYDRPGGVRFEYLMHALPAFQPVVCDLLLMAAAYPFTQEFLYSAGCVVPIGTPIVDGSDLDYLYLTYPYIDDPHIYTDHPYGQIATESILIQTWWVFPIARSEIDPSLGRPLVQIVRQLSLFLAMRNDTAH